jgi:hypothetical protein
MAADLNGATVKIVNSAGTEVPATYNQQVLPGMLLRTLIIQPQIDTKKLTDKDFFDVSIELKDKRKFSYRVQLF